MINLTRLRHVVAVDQAGSFSAAAEAVHVTQSALTKSVAAVEEEVGHALFERRARGTVTTAEGRDFIDRAKRIVAELDMLVEDTQRQRKRERSQLRIGVCPPSIEPFLSQPLAQLVGRYPGLSLHLTALSSERALRFLKRGDFDMVVGPDDLFRNDSRVHAEKVGQLQAFLFVRKGHPLLTVPNPGPEELKRYQIITPELFTSYAGIFERLFEGPDVDLRDMVSVIDHFPLVTAIIRKSDRIGVVGGEYHLAPAFARNFEILPVEFFEPLVLSCATLAGEQVKPTARALTAMLREAWGEMIGRERH